MEQFKKAIDDLGVANVLAICLILFTLIVCRYFMELTQQEIILKMLKTPKVKQFKNKLQLLQIKLLHKNQILIAKQ